MGASSSVSVASSPVARSIVSILPDDLQLEIVARTDVTTIIRCASTYRKLRGLIRDQGFRRRRRAVRGEPNGGFDTSLLVGISYRIRIGLGDAAQSHECVLRTLPSSASRPLRFNPILLNSFEPLASRDGLVILKQVAAAAGDGFRDTRIQREKEVSFSLCVCNAITGDVTDFLPAPKINEDICPPALLAVGDGGKSFEVLVMDRTMQTQTFSSKKRRWSRVRKASDDDEQFFLSGRPIVLRLKE
uniref:F-box domain-containing protein n=1 Tax=Leersia perrieri TaxID=77586 RepID=A0A0D9VZP0_9ORYZ